MDRGYGGKLVKIDLTRGKIVEEELDQKILKKWIGGKGLAAHYLYENLDAKVDPLSPDNILFVSTGPATGTWLPLASKIGFFFKSPLTEIFGESIMGGNFPAVFRWLGYIGLAIHGRSEKPVYLYLDGENVEIRDASDLWGLNTEETEKRLMEELGRDIEVAEIGPAGERLIRFAAISHGHGTRMRESKAGRTGGGAVMGSKNLKAIVLRNPGKPIIRVYDEEAVRRNAKKFVEKAIGDPLKSGVNSYRRYGTPITLSATQANSAIPSRYWEYVETRVYEALDPEALRENFYKSSVACWNCMYSCGKISVIEEDGQYKGIVTKGPEYETIFAFGVLNELDDMKPVIALNLLADRYGVDTIEMGSLISLVIYGYEKGLIKLDRPVRFGDVDSVYYLFQLTMERRGIGYDIGEGVKHLAKKYGLEDVAIHVKGLSPPAYDPRSLKGMALSYATSTRGADHLRTTSYAYEMKGILDKDDTSPEKVRFLVDVENLFSIHDSMILCRFGRFVYEWDFTIDILNSLTGYGYTKESLSRIANDIHTVIRRFNLATGMSPKEDYLPKRLFREPGKTLSGGAKSLSLEEFESMLKTYYRLRGWSEEGVPQEVTV